MHKRRRSRYRRLAWTPLVLAVIGCAAQRSPPASVSPVASTSPSSLSGLSLDTPVEKICAYPGGKAVLDRDLPGLTDHPSFSVFKMMTLMQLSKLSGGKMSTADLERVRADLARLSSSTSKP